MRGKWEITLAGDWNDYGAEEDGILKRAYLVGQQHAQFNLRGQDYEYDFKTMMQNNLQSGKEREIRAPRGMNAPPKPLVPQGAVVVIAVPQGVSSIVIDGPNNPGRKLTDSGSASWGAQGLQDGSASARKGRVCGARRAEAEGPRHVYRQQVGCWCRRGRCACDWWGGLGRAVD